MLYFLFERLMPKSNPPALKRSAVRRLVELKMLLFDEMLFGPELDGVRTSFGGSMTGTSSFTTFCINLKDM